MFSAGKKDYRLNDAMEKYKSRILYKPLPLSCKLFLACRKIKIHSQTQQCMQCMHNKDFYLRKYLSKYNYKLQSVCLSF